MLYVNCIAIKNIKFHKLITKTNASSKCNMVIRFRLGCISHRNTNMPACVWTAGNEVHQFIYITDQESSSKRTLRRKEKY